MAIAGIPCIFECIRLRKPDTELERVEIIANNKSTARSKLDKRYFLKGDEYWEIVLKKRFKVGEIPRSWVR